MNRDPLRIVVVNTPKLLDKFIRFPFRLYKNNPYWAPPLDYDEKKTLTKKNPALEFCDFECILIFRGKEIVGRMALIINNRYNQENNARMGRFGWVDFIDDFEVSKAMFDYGVTWHKERGMQELHGPLGFTDFDYEGMLVEGFDRLGTMGTVYNYEYYNKHVLDYGFQPKAKWIERLLSPISGDKWDLENTAGLSKLILQRSNARIAEIKEKKQLLGYAQELFGLVNLMYKKLYGFTTLNQAQIDYFIKNYFPLANPDFIPILLNEKNEVIAFVIAFPSFTKALQKNEGRLFPFGFLRMLRALKKNDTLDLYLTAVHPNYLNKGLLLPLIDKLAVKANKMGINKVEVNIVLEDNLEMSNFYNRKSNLFQITVTKKRISYYLNLDTPK